LIFAPLKIETSEVSAAIFLAQIGYTKKQALILTEQLI
jgi:hypothetical protein